MAVVTIDNSAPTSSVVSLPAFETNANFTVCWSGTDIGSGIVAYDIYVATNGGPWNDWLALTPNTCEVFTGQGGQTYSFYSVAHDGVGNLENAVAVAQATTIISTIPLGMTVPATIVTNSAPGECGQFVAFAPVATGYPTPTVNLELGPNFITSPWFFPIGTNTVTCTASNVTGIAQGSFSVAVVDSTPPVAGTTQLGATENAVANVPVPKLLAVAINPRAGVLSITSVSAASTNGGTLVLSGGMISYTPATNFVGQDLFNYTLSDGCDTARGTILVNVTAGNQQSLNQISIVAKTSGTTLVFAGIPGINYIVQSEDSLAGPWTDLSGQITAGPTGLIQFTDTTTPMPPSRFYRTRAASAP